MSSDCTPSLSHEKFATEPKKEIVEAISFGRKTSAEIAACSKSNPPLCRGSFLRLELKHETDSNP